jgi:alkyl hydroperoxide reductase subunit AhpF
MAQNCCVIPTAFVPGEEFESNRALICEVLDGMIEGVRVVDENSFRGPQRLLLWGSENWLTDAVRFLVQGE